MNAKEIRHKQLEYKKKQIFERKQFFPFSKRSLTMEMFKVTADDFGYCSERNRGIMELVKMNIVQNVSVIVNGNSVVNINIDNNIHIGLHFNVTEGIPISDSGKGHLSLIKRLHVSWEVWI